MIFLQHVMLETAAINHKLKSVTLFTDGPHVKTAKKLMHFTQKDEHSG